jgi:hypothetical protein
MMTASDHPPQGMLHCSMTLYTLSWRGFLPCLKMGMDDDA